MTRWWNPRSGPALLGLVIVVCLAKEDVVHDLSVVGEGISVPRNISARPRLEESRRYKRWTKGVDSQISMAQAELAAASVKSREAEEGIVKLKAKQEAELKKLQAQRARKPDEVELSDEDINQSYGRLIEAEQKELKRQQGIIQKVQTYLGKLEEAKKTIVKSAMGFLAVEQLEASKRAKQHQIKAELYQQFQNETDHHFQTWARNIENRIVMQKRLEMQKEDDTPAEDVFKVSSEVNQKAEASQDYAKHSLQGIAERIRLQSDGQITKLTSQVDSARAKRIERYEKAKVKMSKKMAKFRSESLEDAKPDTNTTAKNAARQARANAAALLKLAEKHEDPPAPTEYDNEYEAYKMSLTASHNESAAAEMTKMNEQVQQLKDWHKGHEEAEQQHLTSFLTKVKEEDKKETELNNLYLKANEMASKKDALEKMQKVKKEMNDMKHHLASSKELPTPEIPEEYKTPVNGRGQPIITKMPSVQPLQKEIDQARAAIAAQGAPQPSHVGPPHLEAQITAVEEGIELASKVAGVN